jgi:hypothetical protein
MSSQQTGIRWVVSAFAPALLVFLQKVALGLCLLGGYLGTPVGAVGLLKRL